MRVREREFLSPVHHNFCSVSTLVTHLVCFLCCFWWCQAITIHHKWWKWWRWAATPLKKYEFPLQLSQHPWWTKHPKRKGCIQKQAPSVSPPVQSLSSAFHSYEPGWFHTVGWELSMLLIMLLSLQSLPIFFSCYCGKSQLRVKGCGRQHPAQGHWLKRKEWGWTVQGRVQNQKHH